MKRIVVGLDGSAHQTEVLRAALTSGDDDTKLVLVRAVSMPTALPPQLLSVVPDAVGPLLIEAARTELETLARTVPAARLDGIRVELGTPWRTLVDVATETHADLLVIGSHGYGGIDRLLGTTAAKVVNHATCSVLVVR